MTAKEMFEELGYFDVSESYELAKKLYITPIEFYDSYEEFAEDVKNIGKSEMIGIGFMTLGFKSIDIVKLEFEAFVDEDETVKIQKPVIMETCSPITTIRLEELKAINKQCEELGWLDEQN